MRASVPVVLRFAPVRKMEIWIDFDSLLATKTGAIERAGETDAEAVLLFKNPHEPPLS